MNESSPTFTYDNPVFSGYAFYSSILMVKMFAMAFLTSYQRVKKKAFINAEDAAMANAQTKSQPDEDVERVRRAHLNDLENIPIFLITGLIFVAANPNVIFALMMFRIYTLARIMHTLVYAVFIIRQPARTIAYGIGLLINVILIIYIMVSFPQL